MSKGEVFAVFVFVGVVLVAAIAMRRKKPTGPPPATEPVRTEAEGRALYRQWLDFLDRIKRNP